MEEPSEKPYGVETWSRYSHPQAQPTRASLALALLITVIWARLHEGDIAIVVALLVVALVLFLVERRVRRAAGGPR
jgi:hypothetical protein